MYSCPCFDFGRGPTQSINNFSNGSPITGIGLRGAFGTVWFDLPARWQTLQERQKLDTADFTPGQYCWDEGVLMHKWEPKSSELNDWLTIYQVVLPVNKTLHIYTSALQLDI